MRDYIPNHNFRIDGRNIPYPVFTSYDYFLLHDRVEDVDSFIDSNIEIDNLVTQIIALKQSCYLLLHTAYSCQSLSDGLYQLKLRLIAELKEKYSYSFDDDWMESLVPSDTEETPKNYNNL